MWYDFIKTVSLHAFLPYIGYVRFGVGYIKLYVSIIVTDRLSGRGQPRWNTTIRRNVKWRNQYFVSELGAYFPQILPLLFNFLSYLPIETKRQLFLVYLLSRKIILKCVQGTVSRFCRVSIWSLVWEKIS